MRILLDECIDQRFARDLEDHDVSHVRALGWASLGDGALLRRASQEFEVFLTVDRGIAFQQNLSGVSVAIIVLRVKRNTRAHLRPLVPELLGTLDRVRRLGDVAASPAGVKTLFAYCASPSAPGAFSAARRPSAT